MDAKNSSRKLFILNSGAILAVPLTVFQLIIYITKNFDTQGWGWLLWLIYASFIYFFMVRYRDQHLEGLISYGKGVGFGVVISVYAGIIVGFFTFLLLAFIYPELQNILMANAEETFLSSGLSEAYLEKLDDVIHWSASPWTHFFSSIFGGAFYGLIVALIVSAFVKRKGDPFQEAMKDVE